MQVLKYDEQGTYSLEDIPFHEDGTALHVPPATEAPPLPSETDILPNSDFDSE